MKVATAQLPEPHESDDRVFVTSNAIVVLDGASAFRPVPVSAATYADTLGSHVASALQADPEARMTEVLAGAIEASRDQLSLEPGNSPSSTIAIARFNADGAFDLLVLGDSQIATPEGIIRDDRQAAVAQNQRRAYRKRLLDGHGYDDRHAELIRVMQDEQARNRNRDTGFWIAEANPRAAHHALTKSLHAPWLVLSTDGAYRTLEHLGLADWKAISQQDAVALHASLRRCHVWETGDFLGVRLPRSKRHDDKTLVAVRN